MMRAHVRICMETGGSSPPLPTQGGTMLAKCTDKYKNKSLEIIQWSFVFVGLGDMLGKFMIYAENEDTYEVNRVYELDMRLYEDEK